MLCVQAEHPVPGTLDQKVGPPLSSLTSEYLCSTSPPFLGQLCPPNSISLPALLLGVLPQETKSHIMEAEGGLSISQIP